MNPVWCFVDAEFLKCNVQDNSFLETLDYVNGILKQPTYFKGS